MKFLPNICEYLQNMKTKNIEIHKIFYELFKKNQYRANYIPWPNAPKRCTLYVLKYDFYIVKR